MIMQYLTKYLWSSALLRKCFSALIVYSLLLSNKIFSKLNNKSTHIRVFLGFSILSLSVTSTALFTAFLRQLDMPQSVYIASLSITLIVISILHVLVGVCSVFIIFGSTGSVLRDEIAKTLITTSLSRTILFDIEEFPESLVLIQQGWIQSNTAFHDFCQSMRNPTTTSRYL